jgi:hypothetical protein
MHLQMKVHFTAYIFRINTEKNIMSCEEKEVFIPYPAGEKTRIYVNCTDAGTLFTVFLTGEEGNITIYSRTDALGNETWYEGDGTVSDRAEEIGKLLEIS